MNMPRPFWTLFAIQFIGALSDNIYRNALLIYATFTLVHDRGDAVPIVSLAAGLFILPFFLFSGMAGRWADRSDQARNIVILKAIEIPAVIFAVAALAWGSVPLMLLALFGLGVLAACFGPLKYSVLPRLVPSENMPQANGYVEAATFVAILIGMIIGGVVVLMPDGVLWLAVLLLGLSIIAFVLARSLPALPPVTATAVRLSVWQYIRQAPEMQQGILGIASLWFVGSVYLTLLPDFVKTTLQAPPVLATTFMALFAVGVACGAILSPRLVQWMGRGFVVTAALTALALFSVMIWPVITYLPDDIGLLSLMMVMVALAAGVFSVPFYTMLLLHSPDHMRAAIVAANNVVNAGFMVGASVFIMLAHAVGLQAPHIFALTGLGGLWLAFYFRRCQP